MKTEPIEQHLHHLRIHILIFLTVFIAVCAVNGLYLKFNVAILFHPLKMVLSQLSLPSKHLVFFSPLHSFFTQVKIVFWISLLYTLPLALIQIFIFLFPALGNKEKIIAIIYFFLIPILFYLGIFLSYFYIIPNALKFLLRFGDVSLIRYMPELSYYIGFLLKFSLIFSIALLYPLILMGLIQFNIISISQLKKIRKYVIVIVFIIAAVMTPPDPISQIVLAVILYIIFEFALFLSFIIQKLNGKKQIL